MTATVLAIRLFQRRIILGIIVWPLLLSVDQLWTAAVWGQLQWFGLCRAVTAVEAD